MPEQVDHGFYQEYKRTPEETKVRALEKRVSQLEKELDSCRRRLDVIDEWLAQNTGSESLRED